MQAVQSNNPSQPQASDSVYFDFQAEAGMTKHMGGAKATDDMLDLCHVQAGQHLLDVGCGSGISTCYMAKQRDCHVTGVDIREKMVERAKITAQSENLESQTDFRQADAQALPFPDDHFDAVLCQSVLAFVPDKDKAMREFMRVTKPGGYIAFTEAHWAVQPEPEMQKFLEENAGPETNLLPQEEWVALLETSGLVDTSTQSYAVNPMSDARNQIRQTGCLRILGVWARAIGLFATSSRYRDFAKTAAKLPTKLANSMGYGIYVGRKPADDTV